MQVTMTKPLLQSLIAYNAKRINDLEEEVKYLRACISIYWADSDPLNRYVESCTAFHRLNTSKDCLRKVKAELKTLRLAQKALKQATWC